MVILYSNNIFVASLPIIAAGGLLAQKTLPHMQKYLKVGHKLQISRTLFFLFLITVLNIKRIFIINKMKLPKYLNFNQIKFEDVRFFISKRKKVP